MPQSSSPVAVICGANGRLGSRLVSGFRADGYTVVEFTKTCAPGSLQIATNMLDEESVRQAFEEVVSRHGGMDVVVQTVGGWGMKPLVETSLAEWTSLVALNLTSTFLCFREAARHMKQRGGRLIAISSRQGAVRGVAQQAAYSAAKAGVIRLVEATAAEFGSSGLTAHALAPSTILFGEGSPEDGVRADDLVRTCLFLSTPSGAALNGATIEAF